MLSYALWKLRTAILQYVEPDLNHVPYQVNVCFTHCFSYLAEIMILELTAENENQNAFEVQAYFNSSQSKCRKSLEFNILLIIIFSLHTYLNVLIL